MYHVPGVGEKFRRFSSGLGSDVSKHGHVSRPASRRLASSDDIRMQSQLLQTKSYVILQSGLRILPNTACKHQLLMHKPPNRNHNSRVKNARTARKMGTVLIINVSIMFCTLCNHASIYKLTFPCLFLYPWQCFIHSTY